MSKKGKIRMIPLLYNITDLIAKKWSMLILRVIYEEKEARYSQITSRLTDINPKILSDRLTELQQQGLIKRNVTDDKPVDIRYTLTKKGKGLVKAITPLAKWAQKWV